MTPRDENLALIIADDAVTASFERWEVAQMDWFFSDQYENAHAGPPTLEDAVWFQTNVWKDRYFRALEDDEMDRESRRADEDERDQFNIAKAQGY